MEQNIKISKQIIKISIVIFSLFFLTGILVAETNLALNNMLAVSSEPQPANFGANAVDGNTGTRRCCCIT